jgi:hypothetical protein
VDDIVGLVVTKVEHVKTDHLTTIAGQKDKAIAPPAIELLPPEVQISATAQSHMKKPKCRKRRGTAGNNGHWTIIGGNDGWEAAR